VEVLRAHHRHAAAPRVQPGRLDVEREHPASLRRAPRAGPFFLLAGAAIKARSGGADARAGLCARGGVMLQRDANGNRK